MDCRLLLSLYAALSQSKTSNCWWLEYWKSGDLPTKGPEKVTKDDGFHKERAGSWGDDILGSVAKLEL